MRIVTRYERINGIRCPHCSRCGLRMRLDFKLPLYCPHCKTRFPDFAALEAPVVSAA